MADSAVDVVKEIPVVEKEIVTSSIKESPVKESPVKETNGTTEVAEKGENGAKNGAPKENGTKVVDDEEEENGKDEEVSCPIKRKSCTGDADATDATQEKKLKVSEETEPVEETEEPVEA